LIAAAAMLIQIPYSFDELVATGQFLYRRKKAGRSLLKVFFTGDTDDGDWQDDADSFRQKPRRILREMFGGGVSIPWNLALCVLIGGWLMLTRMSFGTTGGMADADHLIGALVITVAVTCFAETVRLFRFVIIPLGAALLITPFVYEVTTAGLVNSLICGVALIAFSLRRGPAYYSYGSWDRFVR
ncbi:MAG: SPW repeat domain-containing protein, partial [Pseudomonadota bacterium]